MKVRVYGFLAVVFIFFTVFPLFGEDFWEGNAVVVRSGDIDKPGLYALSDSFPKYSKIVVKNLSNGKEVAVTVLDRTHGVTNVFLLLSREAAKKIGIKYGSIAHVRVSLSREPGVVTSGMPGDLPYNPDPDINPAANIPEEEVLIGEKPANVEEKPLSSVKKGEAKLTSPESVKKKEKEKIEIGTAKSVEKKAMEKKPPEERVEGEKESQQSISKKGGDEREVLVRELAKNRPDGLLFKPPVKPGQVVIIEKPIEKPSLPLESKKNLEIAKLPESGEGKGEIPALENLTVPPRKERMSGIEGGVKLPGIEEPKTEIVTKETSKEKKSGLKIENKPAEPNAKETKTLNRGIAKPSAEKPIPKKGEVVLKLEPAGPKPPPPLSGEKPGVGSGNKTKGGEVKKRVKGKSLKPVSSEVEKVTTRLPRGAYFLQIAAYYSETLANKLVSRLSGSYPVTVLSTRKNDRVLYKVLVGPLNRDESGALLYWFRSKGYRDSFIKTP